MTAAPDGPEETPAFHFTHVNKQPATVADIAEATKKDHVVSNAEQMVFLRKYKTSTPKNSQCWTSERDVFGHRTQNGVKLYEVMTPGVRETGNHVLLYRYHPPLTQFVFDKGLIDSCFGPSLQDLQCLYSVSVQTISTLFPVYAGFKTAGSVLYVPVHAVFNVYTLMMVCVLVSSCLVLVIPLCSSFWVAAAASSGLGLTSGVVNSARVAKIGALSQESAIPLHLMGIAMCAGNILGPLIISPFLNNTTNQSNASNMSDLVVTSIECGGSDSRIAYAYLIIASTGTLLVIVLAVLRYCLQNSPKQDSNKKNKYSFGKMEIIFVSFQISLIFIGGATNFVYGTLLLLFGTRSSLSISETTMALMTSSFYAVALLGRVGGVFVSLVVRQLCLVTSCLVGVLAASVFLVFTAEMSSEFLWAGSHFLGLCYAPLFSALLAWCVENVTVNDTLYAIFILFDLAGTSLIALTIGQLMSHFEPQMLHYSIATIALIQILFFLCLFFLGKWLRKQNKEDYIPLDGTKCG